MFHLRPAYVPPIFQARNRLVYVGAEAVAQVQQAKGASAGETGLYVGVPAAGVGALAYFAGLSAAVTLLAAFLAGGAGYVFLTKVVHKEEEGKTEKGKAPGAAKVCIADLSPEMKKQVEDAIHANDGHALKSYAKEARDHGWTCAADEIDIRVKSIEGETAGTEAERKAKLTIDEVSKEATEPLATQIAGVLSLFTVSAESGKELDYKSALFPAVLTDVQLKSIDDLVASLGAAGYKKAQSQISDVSGAAKVARSTWTPISRAEAVAIPGLATDYHLDFTDPSDPSKTLSDATIDAGVTAALLVNDTAGLFVKNAAGAVKPAVLRILAISGPDYRGAMVDSATLAGIVPPLPPKILTAFAEGPAAGTELHFTASDVAAIKPV